MGYRVRWAELINKLNLILVYQTPSGWQMKLHVFFSTINCI